MKHQLRQMKQVVFKRINCSIHRMYVLTIYSIEPTGIPTNFSAETISASSIKVIWTPVSPELTNGVITMYTICFGTEIVTCSEVSVNASQPLEYTFIDLEPETEYLFRIRAHTAVGAGPYTDSINQTTSKETKTTLLQYHLPD